MELKWLKKGWFKKDYYLLIDGQVTVKVHKSSNRRWWAPVMLLENNRIFGLYETPIAAMSAVDGYYADKK